MSSMLNISVRSDKNKINPSIVNNVSINNSKLNRIPTKLTRTKIRPILQRELTEAVQEATKTDETIKIIHQDGTASVYVEPSPYEGITEDTTEQINVAYVEQQTEQQTEQKEAIDKSLINSVLLQYIQLLREHNIIKPDKFIISADELANIILLITQADEVNISLNQDIGCSIGKIRLIDNIYINKNNERKDFKIFYPNEYTYIRDLKINLKKVIIN